MYSPRTRQLLIKIHFPLVLLNQATSNVNQSKQMGNYQLRCENVFFPGQIKPKRLNSQGIFSAFTHNMFILCEPISTPFCSDALKSPIFEYTWFH